MLSRSTRTIRRLQSRANHSSSSKPYPFPKQVNPTPHQIFHLPKNASQEDIKARYYELVRIYHPDKAHHTVDSEEAHSRFRSISSAYNILRGKSAPDETPGMPSRDPRHEPTTAARRAAHVRRHRELYEAGAVDDRWKDRIILFGVLGTVVVFVAQSALTRQEALEEVLDRARSHRLDSARERNTSEDPRLAAPDSDSKSASR